MLKHCNIEDDKKCSSGPFNWSDVQIPLSTHFYKKSCIHFQIWITHCLVALTTFLISRNLFTYLLLLPHSAYPEAALLLAQGTEFALYLLAMPPFQDALSGDMSHKNCCNRLSQHHLKLRGMTDGSRDNNDRTPYVALQLASCQMG